MQRDFANGLVVIVADTQRAAGAALDLAHGLACVRPLALRAGADVDVHAAAYHLRLGSISDGVHRARTWTTMLRRIAGTIRRCSGRSS